jgi:hypothetical protein
MSNELVINPVEENSSKEKPNCIPPKHFKRNEFGLICDDVVKYVYNEDGTINWRKMIKPEFLAPNKQYFEKFKKKVPESVEGLEDKELIILLGGLKDLAQVRGYSKVRPYLVTCPSDNYVIAVSSIVWIPNYETEGREVEFSSIGEANPNNTNGFGKNFLGPIAENRAFVRCVRNFLRINIVAQEEIGSVEATENIASNLLGTTMNQFGVTFEVVKTKLIEEKFPEAETFKNVEDIPRFKQFELIERIKQKAAEKLVVKATASQ